MIFAQNEKCRWTRHWKDFWPISITQIEQNGKEAARTLYSRRKTLQKRDGNKAQKNKRKGYFLSRRNKGLPCLHSRRFVSGAEDKN